MPAKILWASRNARPVASQIAALRALYGADVVVEETTEENAGELARLFRTGGYRDLVVVMSLAALDRVVRAGLNPLWSQTVEEPNRHLAEFFVERGRGFRFDRFRRLRGVALELGDLAPDPRPTRVLRMTQHRATPEERAFLAAAFPGGFEILEDPRAFRDGREVLFRARAAQADEVVLVAPYSVYEQLVREGAYPLLAVMNGRKCGALKRILGVRVDLEEL